MNLAISCFVACFQFKLRRKMFTRGVTVRYIARKVSLLGIFVDCSCNDIIFELLVIQKRWRRYKFSSLLELVRLMPPGQRIWKKTQARKFEKIMIQARERHFWPLQRYLRIWTCSCRREMKSNARVALMVQLSHCMIHKCEVKWMLQSQIKHKWQYDSSWNHQLPPKHNSHTSGKNHQWTKSESKPSVP